MTLYLLNEHDISFPNPEFAEPDGLLAIGGDLNPERLINAYKLGIFPWYNSPPILWWSPPLRPVIFPRLFRMSRSLYQELKKDKFRVTFDRDFSSVITKCATVRRKASHGTWINQEMISAYTKLHELGFAHSVEVWLEGKLVGGLYGVSIGKVFFGESMFSLMSNTSKIAIACLVAFCIENSFYIIDCQVTNNHLLSLGAVEIPRSVFLTILNEGISKNFIIDKWTFTLSSTKETSLFLRDKLIRRRTK